MELELTEEQQLIKANMREFCEQYVEPSAEAVDRESSFPAENVRLLAEQDMLGIPFPEEYGGAGSDFVTCAMTIEELSRSCASTGFVVAANTSLACFPLFKYGSEEQKKKYLAPLCRGESLGACSVSEIGTDYSASGAVTAHREGGEYVLNGVGTFVANAPVAGVFIVFASTGQGPAGFIVPAGTPGFSAGQDAGRFGIRGAPISEITLKDCRIPKENILGREGQGTEIAMSALDNFRTGIAAVALGIAHAALDESVRYSKERVQFEKAICNFQAIQWMLVDMSTETEVSRLLTYHAAWNCDRGLPYSMEAAMAKLSASSSAVNSADRAVQIHGGIGYIKGQKVERLYRDAKVTQIYAGAPEAMKAVIARTVLQEDVEVSTAQTTL